jgi:hypothetical protein
VDYPAYLERRIGGLSAFRTMLVSPVGPFLFSLRPGPDLLSGAFRRAHLGFSRQFSASASPNPLRNGVERKLLPSFGTMPFNQVAEAYGLLARAGRG